MKSFVGSLLAINILAAAVFAILLFGRTLMSDLSVRSNMTQLDRANVISYPALHKYDPTLSADSNLGTPDVRGKLAVWIAHDPLLAEAQNAALGLIASAMNSIACVAALVAMRKKKPTEPALL